MTLNAIGSAAAAISQFGNRSNVRQDFQNLTSSLQSGNLSGAQQAYADLQKLLKGNNAISTATNSTNSPTSPLSALQQDFQALGQALSSGDLSGAQKDLTQLQKDAQSLLAQYGVQGRGGHHHHGQHVRAQSGAEADGDNDGSRFAKAAASIANSVNPTSQSLLG